jgi:hypothetical protein
MVYSNVDKLEKPKQRTSFGTVKIMADNAFPFCTYPIRMRELSWWPV